MVTDHAALMGEVLRDRRKELDMSQVEVAKLAGIGKEVKTAAGKRRHLGQDHVSKLERGVWEPSKTTMAGLAKALKTTPAELHAEAARRAGGKGNDLDQLAQLLARVEQLEAEVKRLKRRR